MNEIPRTPEGNIKEFFGEQSLGQIMQALKQVSERPYDPNDQRCFHYAQELFAKLTSFLPETEFSVWMLIVNDTVYEDGSLGSNDTDSHAFLIVEKVNSAGSGSGILLEPQVENGLATLYDKDSDDAGLRDCIAKSWLFNEKKASSFKISAFIPDLERNDKI